MIIHEVIKEAPVIGANVLIVWFFLKHLSKRDDFIRNTASACHQVQRDSTAAMRENSMALGETKQALNETLVFLRKTHEERR